MSVPPIRIEIPPAAQALIARAQSWPRAFTRNLIAQLDKLNSETVGHISQHRATGKGPFPPAEGKLGVRTNRYRNALRHSKAVVSGAAIESAIGNNVKYAGVHERGFAGTVTVKEHRRSNAMLDLLEVKGAIVPRWESFGLRGRKTQVASGIVRVRAHQMAMNMPARAPIRRGIDDRLPSYGPALGAAIVAAFTEKGAS
jgi:hypothetical protein